MPGSSLAIRHGFRTRRRAGNGGRSERLCERREERALLLGQVGRNLNLGHDAQLPPATALQARRAPIPEAELMAMLGPGRYAERLLTGKRGDHHVGTERRLGDVKGQFTDDVRTIPLETCVWLHLEADVQVSTRAPALAAFALPIEADFHLVVHPGGNGNRQASRLADASTPVALDAPVGDDLTSAPAPIARRDIDELPEQALLDTAHFTGPIARGTPGRRLARLRARSITDEAIFPAGYFQLLLAPEDGFLKCEFELGPEIGTT
jgi:hypothetical protein